MPKQSINLGTAPTGVGGDTPRSAFTKAQSNFDEIYAALGASGNPGTLPASLPVAQGGTGVATTAALLTSLQSAGAYGKTNAVGTAGQTAGVPTGALMESGSNANGSYWRFANGLQICIGTLISGGTATVQGSIYVSTPASGSFPIAFVVAPVVVASGLYNASGTGWATQATFSSTTTWGNWAVCYGAPNGSTSTIALIAVGRWF